MATVAAIGACGIPTDAEPREITAEQAPIDLNPTTTAPSEGGAEFDLYFVHEGRLIPVERATPVDSITAAIEALESVAAGRQR